MKYDRLKISETPRTKQINNSYRHKELMVFRLNNYRILSFLCNRLRLLAILEDSEREIITLKSCTTVSLIIAISNCT